jgi:hypothetical protein
MRRRDGTRLSANVGPTDNDEHLGPFVADQKSIPELIEILRKGTEHLVRMAKGLEFPWNPVPGDPRQLHNMYARNLITSYVSKFADLSNGLLVAIEQQNFLMYALCGRALIETVAILRYYIVEEYKPLFDKGQLGPDEFKRLIELDDRHLRGGKFDWESFLFQRYSRLKADAVARLQSKGKAKPPDPDAGPQQVRIGRCIESWGRETPEVVVAYNLFCDLVHPNIGSTFLVASTNTDGLYFSRFRGEPVGRAILEQSLPILLSISHRPFGQYLAVLMGPIWQDDEMPKVM